MWTYEHSFAVISIQNWGKPFLIIRENKYYNGQSWGYNYIELKRFDTVEEAHEESKALNGIYGLPKTMSSEASEELLTSIQFRFPEAKIVRQDLAFDVLSPDGFSIKADGFFNTPHEAKEGFDKWIKQFELQGYYSSPTHGRIHYSRIQEKCKFITVDLQNADFVEEQ